MAKDIHRAMGHHYIVEASGCDPEIISSVEAFGAVTSHITEITRGIEEDDNIFYDNFITWEEDFEKGKKKS